ncbi:MAG: two-component regulator propeller domain-containing protein, partial [Polaribacter sp.]
MCDGVLISKFVWMQKLYKTLLFFLIIISVDVNSQQNKLQNYFVSEGLPNTSINDITQDKTGYLWLATDNGYSKFDGIKFINYNRKKANCIFANNSIIYIGFNDGLVVLKNNKASFLESNAINNIQLFNGKIVLATNQGVSELKEDYIQPLQLNTSIDFSIIYSIFNHNN